MNEKLHQIRQLLLTHQLDALLISSYEAIRYLSDFAGFVQHEREAYLFITHQEAYILCNPLYTTALTNQIKHLHVLEYTANRPLQTILESIISQGKIKKIGFEPDDLRVTEWQSIRDYLKQLTPVSLRNLREKKDPSEIAAIEKACRIADKALGQVLPSVKPGITEQKVSMLIEDAIRHMGADIAFTTIVAFGEHAASPHHLSSRKALKNHDLVLIDFGARVTGYNSDMTRTIFVSEPSGEDREMYEHVLEAQKKAVLFIEKQLIDAKPISAADVDLVAREYLIDNGYPLIPHSLGHGIGLQVHESPSLSPYSKQFLTDGMVFSIEPGVYYPSKIGIRIEDLYVISQGKLRRLTKYPSKLHIL